MRYVEAKFRRESLDKTYRIYVTDCLKFISENTAKRDGGTAFNKRYADLLNTKKTEETRSGEEIIEGIRSKIHEL